MRRFNLPLLACITVVAFLTGISPAHAATCLGKTVTINLNAVSHPSPDRANSDVILGTPSADNPINAGAGDDTICAGAGHDVINAGPGKDRVEGGANDDTIVGGADKDTLDYSAATAGVTANLSSPGPNNVVGGGGASQAGTDSVSEFENVVGTEQHDFILGDDSANKLDGRAGRDDIVGNGGNDVLLGGASGLSYEEDRLYGYAGNDTLDGGAGKDFLYGGLDDDTIIGGTGKNTVIYLDAASAVTVDLALSGPQDTGGDGVDTIDSTVQNLIGSGHDDTLKGDENANSIEGYSGSDTVYGRAGADILTAKAGDDATEVDVLLGGTGADTLTGDVGNDTANGGTGIDTLNYAETASDVTSGVTVNLTTGQSGGGAGVDTISGIENVSGTKFADSLTGDGNANVLRGNGSYQYNIGNDVLEGLGGDDELFGGFGDHLNTLRGGEGNDHLYANSNFANTMEGGPGSDILFPNYANDQVDGGDGTDTASYENVGSPGFGVTVNLTTVGSQYTNCCQNDTFVSIESLTGTAYDDILTGSTGTNVLKGLAGNDTLDGEAGADTCKGGSGTGDTAAECETITGVP